MTALYSSDAVPHLRAEVRRVTQRNSYDIMRDQAALADEYASDDYMLTALRQYPLCAHASTLYLRTQEAEGDSQPEVWEAVALTHDKFLDLELEFVTGWITQIFTVNPLLATQEYEYIKNLIAGMGVSLPSTAP